ncbi:MAG: hypothetical protein QXY05_01680 [Candidatus Anstonellales archaeon]
MRFLGILALLMLFAGCISNIEEKNENKMVKIIGEKIYNESSWMNESSEESTAENISVGNNTTPVNETDDAADLNTTNQTFENESYAENGEAKIDGTYFGNDRYCLVLRDISMQRNEIGYCALFEIILVENYTTLQKLQVCPGDDATWISPEGKQYRIKVIDTAAGYSGAARWAKVIVYG